MKNKVTYAPLFPTRLVCGYHLLCVNGMYGNQSVRFTRKSQENIKGSGIGCWGYRLPCSNGYQIVKYDKNKCKKLFDTITNLTVEPMEQVWRARGLHHVILLLDGIVKHRCLFKDYDDTYNPKDEDYDDLERVLMHMAKTWDTDFGGKQEWLIQEK